MVENEKYYVPQKDEFHEGFEYEIKNSRDEWVAAVWKFHKFSEGRFNANLTYAESIRVKYLDKDDIESFGFTNFQRVTEDWYKLYKTIECPISHYTYQALRLRHDRSSGGITIIAYEYEHQMEKDQDGVNLFRGIIKNKSEFVVLLKQLNILRDA